MILYLPKLVCRPTEGPEKTDNDLVTVLANSSRQEVDLDDPCFKRLRTTSGCVGGHMALRAFFPHRWTIGVHVLDRSVNGVHKCEGFTEPGEFLSRR